MKPRSLLLIGLLSVHCAEPMDLPMDAEGAKDGSIEEPTDAEPADADADADADAGADDATPDLGVPDGGSVPTPAPVITNPSPFSLISDHENLHMEIAPAGAGVDHVSTDWEIWHTRRKHRVWSYLEDSVDLLHTHAGLGGRGAFENSLEGVAHLDPESSYLFRVRFRVGPDATPGPWAEFVRFWTPPIGTTMPLRIERLANAPAPMVSSLEALPSDVQWTVSLHDGRTLQQVATIDSSTVTFDAASATSTGSVHVRITAANAVELPLHQLTVWDATTGVDSVIYLPALSLSAGESRTFWVNDGGEPIAPGPNPNLPDLSEPVVRVSPFPWASDELDLKAELVVHGLTSPVSIAFPTSTGTAAGSPWFYVTELFGDVRVVLADRTVETVIEDLITYHPYMIGQTPIGLNGLCVDPTSGDLFATLGRQIDTTFHNVIVRLDLDPGGVRATSQDVFIMTDERIQSNHMIEFCAFGSDGALYTMVGDGFGTGQDLDKFSGKLLRMNADGLPLADNPFFVDDGITGPRDFVYSYGLRNAFGGTQLASGRWMLAENGPSVDRLIAIGEAEDGQWGSTDADILSAGAYHWPRAVSPNGIAIDRDGVLGERWRGWTFVSLLNTSDVVAFRFDDDGVLLEGPIRVLERRGLGTGKILGLTFGPDGLYFTQFLCTDCGGGWPFIFTEGRQLIGRIIPR